MTIKEELHVQIEFPLLIFSIHINFCSLRSSGKYWKLTFPRDRKYTVIQLLDDCHFALDCDRDSKPAIASGDDNNQLL